LGLSGCEAKGRTVRLDWGSASDRRTPWTRRTVSLERLSFVARATLRQAINNRLRTGTDKGNPTV